MWWPLNWQIQAFLLGTGIFLVGAVIWEGFHQQCPWKTLSLHKDFSLLEAFLAVCCLCKYLGTIFGTTFCHFLRGMSRFFRGMQHVGVLGILFCHVFLELHRMPVIVALWIVLSEALVVKWGNFMWHLHKCLWCAIIQSRPAVIIAHYVPPAAPSAVFSKFKF